MPSAQDESWPFLDAMTPQREAMLMATGEHIAIFKLMGVRPEKYEVDYCKLSIDYHDEVSRPGGVMHGGVHATLVDSVVAHAIITTLKPTFHCVTVHLDVKYFKATTAGRLFAEGRVVKKGRRIVHGEVRLTDETGELLGHGWCVYAVTRQGRALPAR